MILKQTETPLDAPLTESEPLRELPSPGKNVSVLERLVGAEPTLPMPRLLVVFAHPDDEVLALGGRLHRLRLSRLLCVTDGAPLDGADAGAHGFATLEEYRKARRIELEAALALGGLPPECAQPLLVDGPDGENRLLPDQTAALHLSDLTRAVMREMERFRPEAVLTHPYEGGHPDHDSCAFAVHTAVRLLGGSPRPAIIEAPFYHSAPNGMETGTFLPALQHDGSEQQAPIVCELSASEQARKREMLACFRTQRETLAQFGTEREQFRVAPEYDFRRRPQAGRLFYEGFPWGMSGDRLCELAAAAAEELGVRKLSGGPGMQWP